MTYFVNGPESKTLPLEIYDNVKKGLNPMLNAVSALFIVVTVVVVILAEKTAPLESVRDPFGPASDQASD